jgi:hypothetical protein
MRDCIDLIVNRLLEYRDRHDRSRDSRAVFTHAYVSITRLIADQLATYKFDFHDRSIRVINWSSSRILGAGRLRQRESMRCGVSPWRLESQGEYHFESTDE